MTGIIICSSSSSSLLLFFFLFASSTSSQHEISEDGDIDEMGDPCSTCPYFLHTPSAITTNWGRPVSLSCGVRNIGNAQVSWIRWRDLHVLTTGNFTFTSESHFKAVHVPGSPVWTLHLESPQPEDSGTYKCQVSTQPMIARLYTLNVVVPEAKITKREMYVTTGVTIRVMCEVVGTVYPHAPITWYHTPLYAGGVGVERINAGGRGGVQVVTDKRAGTSWLLVTNVTAKDAGNYTCAPELAKPTSALIHVINVKVPAAIQHDAQPDASGSRQCHPTLPLILLVVFWCTRHLSALCSDKILHFGVMGTSDISENIGDIDLFS